MAISNQITTPTTVVEFRHLANAFSTGSQFEAGTSVYVVALTAGSRGVIDVIAVNDPEAQSRVNAALARVLPGDATGPRAIYQVAVPLADEEDPSCVRASFWDPTQHGHCYLEEMARDASSAAPPASASLNDVASMELRVTWKNDAGTSVYNLRPSVDAITLTQGATETFFLPAYATMFGDAYARRLRDRILSSSGGGEGQQSQGA